MKTKLASFVVAFLLLAVAESYAQTGVYIGVGYGRIPAFSIDIPEGLRTVPTYPSDGPVKQRVIPATTVEIPSSQVMTMVYGPQVRVKALVLRGGIQFSGALQGNNSPTEPLTGMVEWGQFVNNNNRGYGTSLVYTQFEAFRNTFGLFAEGELGSPSIGLVFGLSSVRSKLTYRNGWDRYNTLQINNEIESSSWVKQPYVGLTVSPFGDSMKFLAIRAIVGKESNSNFDFGGSNITKSPSGVFFNIGMVMRFGRK